MITIRLQTGARWTAWAAIAALLLAGLLGPLHRGLHAGESRHALAAATTADSASASTLFVAHDEGDPECRLLDQALQFHGTAAASAWLPAVVPQGAAAAADHDLISRRAFAAYRARAPPGAA